MGDDLPTETREGAYNVLVDAGIMAEVLAAAEAFERDLHRRAQA